ncbi:MAG: helix-turn-helix domain-containing protein [Geminicoccaceae bacterium]
MNLEQQAFHSEFGAAVYQRREGAGMSQDELANLIGMTRPSVCNIERGRQRVYVHKAVMIAQALGVEFEDLLPEPGGIGIEELMEGFTDAQKRFVRSALSSAPVCEEGG